MNTFTENVRTELWEVISKWGWFKHFLMEGVAIVEFVKSVHKLIFFLNYCTYNTSLNDLIK